MTYARQLDDYEEAVMRKRLEEMPDEEVDRMVSEVDETKAARAKRIAERQDQQQR